MIIAGFFLNALRVLATPEHNFHKLHVGNYETLKGYINNTEELRRFHHKYYVPGNMFLVI